ncbi:cytochrome P450 2C31-like [Tetranychus urticae]|uniref:Cytochrome P450 n=1 Tax=Tetranychus urticae TaxID=32264 RepID=T1KP57_TETUR|nr:cytochrome P450 2C31-like [Tetranychus urticae]
MFLTDYFVFSQPLYSIASGLIFLFVFNFLVTTVKRLFLLPPGPWGLPIVGYYPFLKDESYLAFDSLSKKYGPVYCLKLGLHDVVVICDWDHLKLAFADESLLARPYETFFEGLINEPSFIEMSGEPWRAHRRLSLQVLRNVGFGTSKMEDAVSTEIQQFLPTIGKSKVDFIAKILPSVSNNISLLLFGHRFDYSDAFKVELDDNMERVNQAVQFAGLTAFFPWLARIFAIFKLSGMDIIDKCMNAAEDLIQKEIDRHQVKTDMNEIEDYIDGYLVEQKNRHNKDENDEVFNNKVLLRNVTEFFAAGSETVTSTLSWAMMYLIYKPEYQDKIRTEISDVIGFDREPLYVDRNRMPFTMAFLYEAQRIGSVIAVNLLRRAARDTKIGEYNIPQDTVVIFNLWSIHRDPKLWPEPEKFDPNRFLSEDGSKAIKPPYLVPFSGGKRICLGEGLANVELFLYLVNILQKYRVRCDPDVKLSFESVFGVARRPKHLPLLTFEKIASQN